MTFAQDVGKQAAEIRQRVEELSRKDARAVARSLEGFITERVERGPFRALATSFGVGFGLATLGADDFRRAVLHLGKLVTYRSLSQDIEKKRTQGDRNAHLAN